MHLGNTKKELCYTLLAHSVYSDFTARKYAANMFSNHFIIFFLFFFWYCTHFSLSLTSFVTQQRRDLKKGINFLCGELFAECVAIMHYQKPTPQEDVDNVMASILNLQDDMLSRVSHVEPGMKAKDYFKKLREDMLSHTDEIVEHIKALL